MIKVHERGQRGGPIIRQFIVQGARLCGEVDRVISADMRRYEVAGKWYRMVSIGIGVTLDSAQDEWEVELTYEPEKEGVVGTEEQRAEHAEPST